MSCNGDCNQGRECNCKCKMTKDEALRMAIEALEKSKDILEYEGMIPDGYEEAIQACKEALAETQDGNCCTEGCIKCDARKVLAETQEPMIIKQENGMVLKLGYDELPNGTAFYTTPSREWQSLSDEEINDCVETGIAKWKKESTETYYSDMDLFIYREFDAKLREKNNA